MERLEKLKLLLNQSSEEHDSYLELLLELIADQAMIYIGKLGRPEPAGLESVILTIAAEYVRQNQLAGAEVAVKSVSRGDTSISYNTADLSAAGMGDFVSLYGHLLRPFMRVKMR